MELKLHLNSMTFVLQMLPYSNLPIYKEGSAMKKKMNALIAAMMFVPFSLFNVNCHAEETVKNWDYYAALDDYAVYSEYCAAHGLKAEETLPNRKELPCYDSYVYQGYVIFDDMIVSLEEGKNFTDEEEMSHRTDASYYGFPKEWIVKDDNPLEIYNLGGVLTFRFNRHAAETEGIRANLVNGYRIELTILNSDFAKDYPIQNIGAVRPDGELNLLGDVNLDGTVDIMDVILVNKYILGCNELTEAQQLTADVNQDGTVDNTDSLTILKFAIGVIDSGDDLTAK